MQPTQWEKIFANDMANKGLISKIRKQLIQFNIGEKKLNKKGQQIWTFFRRRYTDGSQAHEKMLNITSHQFSRSVMSDSVIPRTAACQASLSITNSWSLLKVMSIELVMPSNHLILCIPFSSCLQCFPASGSFPMSQFFASDGQSIGVSASTSVLPMNIQQYSLLSECKSKPQ